jgi:hypothetical protein
MPAADVTIAPAVLVTAGGAAETRDTAGSTTADGRTSALESKLDTETMGGTVEEIGMVGMPVAAGTLHTGVTVTVVTVTGSAPHHKGDAPTGRKRGRAPTTARGM